MESNKGEEFDGEQENLINSNVEPRAPQGILGRLRARLAAPSEDNPMQLQLGNNGLFDGYRKSQYITTGAWG